MKNKTQPCVWIVWLRLMDNNGKSTIDTTTLQDVTQKYAQDYVESRIQDIKDNAYNPDGSKRVYTKAWSSLKHFIINHEESATHLDL